MTDLEIAHGATMRPITEIAEILGLPKDDIIQYGKYKAKILLKYLDRQKVNNANLILVSAISPTPAGEG